jgi:cell division protease FtsH
MASDLGQVVLEKQDNSYLGSADPVRSQKDYSQETAREIDLAVRELIDEAYTRAKALLAENSDDLKRGAALLLERETITPDEFPPLKPFSQRLQDAAE